MNNVLEIFERIVNELIEEERKSPVSDYVPSDELYSTLDLSLNMEGMQDETFEQALKELVLKTPRTATSGFFNQLFG